MKNLFKGLLVAGVGAAIGYIVVKKVNEKEENKETTREEVEPLEKEEVEVLDKVKEIVKNTNKHTVLAASTIIVLIFKLYKLENKVSDLTNFSNANAMILYNSMYEHDSSLKDTLVTTCKGVLESSDSTRTVKELATYILKGVD